MNRTELKEKLETLGIKNRNYSLYGDLNSGSIVLYHSYYEWQVFNLNDRGVRESFKVFNSEEEACKYILDEFIKGINMGL